MTRGLEASAGLAFHVSTMWQTKAVDAAGIGGRSGDDVEMLLSHHDLNQKTGAFGKPARSKLPKLELMCGQASGSPYWCEREGKEREREG